MAERGCISEKISLTAYAFMTRASYAVKLMGGRIYLILCVPVTVFGFPDGNNIWSTVLYTKIVKVKRGGGG